MQMQTFCWLPLRRGAIIISAACFVMAILNVVSAAIPPDKKVNVETSVVSRSVHAVLAVIYAAAGALLAFALFQGSLTLVRLWLGLFAILTLVSLLAHDLARYDWMTLEEDSSTAVVAGIGLLNIVLDVVFLMAVFALMREMERQKSEDVAAASNRRPRAAPGATSVAPALPLREIVPRAHASAATAANATDITVLHVEHEDDRCHENGNAYGSLSGGNNASANGTPNGYYNEKDNTRNYNNETVNRTTNNHNNGNITRNEILNRYNNESGMANEYNNANETINGYYSDHLDGIVNESFIGPNNRHITT